MSDPEVLIVGAGPTGLLLALWLDHLGIRVRIIDHVAEPGTTSRALVVHARTLELYAQIGLAEEVVQRGFTFAAINLWFKGRKRARIAFGEIGKGISPYPYLLVFPQDEHERFLIDRLEERGVHVERPVEFVSFQADGEAVVAQLRHPSGEEESCRAGYLCGCDGAHSIVRHGLNANFPGGTNTQLLFVADLEGEGPTLDGEMHGAIDEADFLGAFPMKGGGRARVIGLVPPSATATEKIGFESVAEAVSRRLSMEVRKVNWFSTYKVHHRVVEHFRHGRIFLLGDAAHIHSPVGGQGMNTGLGDAVNLAWKLAAVLRNGAPDGLLDTYETERIAFAQGLIRSTDRAFSAAVSATGTARFTRVWLLPLLAPLLFRLRGVRRFMFRTVSQTKIDYRQSALSSGSVGEVHGGDRLPWAPLGAGGDNFASLKSNRWQVHVYGVASAQVREMCDQSGIPLHAFAWEEAMGPQGLTRDAVYLVRPDGYVALACAAGDQTEMQRYLGVNSWVVDPCHTK